MATAVGLVFPALAVALLSQGDFAFGSTPPFYINFCAPSSSEQALGFHVLNAQHGAWPLDQFCQAVSSAAAQPGDYDLSIKLYNYKGRGQANLGHPGVLFNARDSMNYDFVYFRPHSAPSCYQTGYVENGVVTTTTSDKCTNGPPKGRTWFHVKISVRGPHSASIYLDNQLVKVHKMHFPALRRGGALVANGYSNLVYFAGYTIEKHPAGPEPLQLSGCVAGTGWTDIAGRVLLNAAHGSWPASGFCRMLLPLTLPDSTTAYEFSTRLYNIQQNVAHPGVMYNVQDTNNYDFIYFRPHSAGRCYQTGYVKNGALNWTGAKSAACNGGVPPRNAWFSVKVKVTGADSAQVYKDGQLVVSIDPHFGVIPRVGLNVANGYGNKIYGDSFQLQAIDK